MRRLPALEMAIFAFGRQQFNDQFEKEDPALRPGLIELHTYLAYEKQLKNLHIQEARLRRQHDKDTAELRQLQQERQEAAVGARHASPAPETFQNGFEFSPDPLRTADIAATTPQPPEPSPAPYANAA